MTSLPYAEPKRSAAHAGRLLKRAGAAWFVAALFGQAIFAVYIFIAFWLTAAAGDWAYWTEHLFTGIIAGDVLGNALMVMHLTLAFIITASGPLQLIPAVRQHVPALHRWNGRAYVLVALVISAGATALIWTRPAFGGPINAALQSFNGAAIFTCALLALQTARGRNFASHRRWATRLFLAASGVWFLRVMMIAWAIPTGGLGLGEQLDGPMGRAAMLGQTVIPLAVYQLYLMAEDSPSGGIKTAMAAFLAMLTLIMIGGIVGVTFGMWLPRILP
jgi:Predicted membrane protein (DUF2306)